MECMSKWLPATLMAAATSLAVTNVYAIEPAAAQWGPVYVAPTLDVEMRYVDNLFRSERDEKSTWVLDTLPKIQAWLQNGNSTYSASVQIQDFAYKDSSDDSFTDKQANLDIHHEFNARNTLNLNAEWYDGHEQRGTGLTEGGIANLIDEPVELETTRYGGDYTFGGDTSKGRLQLGYQFLDNDYQNFREQTQYRDREADTLNGIFFWKLGPKTDLLAEVRYIETEYDTTRQSDPAGSLDSEETNYYLGVKWDATAKTSGSIRLGTYDREYDSSGRKDDDGFSWEVDVDYKPRSYSNINFGTRRFSQETNGLGNAINTEEYTIGWDHDWSGRSSTRVGFLLADDDYEGSRRQDDRTEFEASYRYAVKRWFDVGGGYRYEERDSNSRTNPLDYDLNVYFIEAQLSL